MLVVKDSVRGAESAVHMDVGHLVLIVYGHRLLDVVAIAAGDAKGLRI